MTETNANTQEPKPIDYRGIIRKQFQNTVRNVLAYVAEEGLNKCHRLIIEFDAEHPDVTFPSSVVEKNGSLVLIVLENQFWGLSTTDDKFEVDLNFSGKITRISVPFDAITMFMDSAHGIEFTMDGEE